MAHLDDITKNILRDLYDIDPSFRQHEERLVKIISHLLSVRPDTKFDAQFAAELKHRLMARADEQLPERAALSFKLTNFMNSIKYAAGALAVLVLGVLVGTSYNNGKLGVPNVVKNNELFSSELSVSSLGSEAFGRLTNASSRGQGGGGFGQGGDAMTGAESASLAAEADSQKSAGMTVPPGVGGGGEPLVSFKYVYKGEDFSIENNQMDVYRRVKGLSSDAAAQALQRLNFGLVDMSTFSNTSVQSVNLVEDKEYGYNFYIQFQEGTISISENWAKWPSPDKLCRDQQCFESLRLSISDIPADPAIIEIANRFLDEHRISRANYGEPVIQDFWRQEYDRIQDKSQFYVPDSITVIYPLKINGQEVYDEGGNKTGLSVNVNIRAKRASGVYELSSQNFESSSYGVETDVQKLLGQAEKGGRGGYYYEVPERTLDVELGTPTVNYVKVWNYKDGQSEELLVPALIFPVTKAPESGYFYRQSVVVPLVKDLLNEDDGPIRIMPLAEPVQ